MLKAIISYIVLLACFSCSYQPKHPAYQEFYSHLRPFNPTPMAETDFFLIVLVEARHLDYTDNHSFFNTLAKHPSDGSKNGDVGHAWIYLQGIVDGQCIFLEGGHSGELGLCQPKYFEGVMNYIDFGDEPNPIKYLWATQKDGFFQEGSGKHKPTFAAKVDLTEAQFHQILAFIENYNYAEYSLTGNQCSSFVAQTALLADFPLEYEVTIPISQTVSLCGEKLTLWQDPQYSAITVSTPDVIERSLMEAVRIGRAEYALSWYNKRHPHPFCLKQISETITKFPGRLHRYLALD